MPNWVYNRVHGSKEACELLLDESRKVTFQKLKPIPPLMDALDEFTFNNDKELKALVDLVYHNNDSELKSVSLLPYNEGKTFDEVKQELFNKYPVNQIIICKELIDQEGTSDWYKWRLNNWGCKWDANNDLTPAEGYPEDVTEIEFLTPWDAPTSIIQTIADLYPDLAFTWHADEESCMFSVDYDFNGDGSIETEEVFPEWYTPYIQEPQDIEYAGMDNVSTVSEALEIIADCLDKCHYTTEIITTDTDVSIKLTAYDWGPRGTQGDLLYEHTWGGLKDA